VPLPIVEATPRALEVYGCLIDDPSDCRIEIVRWPATGTRPVDAGTGDQGGTTEGVFVSEWRGDVLYGRNEAVDGHYILAYAQPPESAREDHTDRPQRMPGDDITPQQFVCFHFSGQQGLYIHPNIWHEGVFGLSGTQRFFDKQGAVHARVSVDFAREFGCLLEAAIPSAP
jgi:hypothetical protein